MNQHHKSLSFLMELLIVIFFFTIASGICVLVMSNVIDEENDYLYKSKFYLNEEGVPQQEEAMYQVTIAIKQEGSHGDLCEMHITKQNKETAVLSFYRQEVRP